MEQQQIIEGNKIIGKFAGQATVINKCEYCGEDVNKEWICNGDKEGNKRNHALGSRLVTLKYHTSWDWLMPVVENIGSLESNMCGITVGMFYEGDIHEVWLHVVSFY